MHTQKPQTWKIFIQTAFRNCTFGMNWNSFTGRPVETQMLFSNIQLMKLLKISGQGCQKIGPSYLLTVLFPAFRNCEKQLWTKEDKHFIKWNPAGPECPNLPGASCSASHIAPCVRPSENVIIVVSDKISLFFVLRWTFLRFAGRCKTNTTQMWQLHHCVTTWKREKKRLESGNIHCENGELLWKKRTQWQNPWVCLTTRPTWPVSNSLITPGLCVTSTVLAQTSQHTHTHKAKLHFWKESIYFLPIEDQAELEVSLTCSKVGCRLAIDTLSWTPDTIPFICWIASSAMSILSNVTKAQLKQVLRWVIVKAARHPRHVIVSCRCV